MEPRDFHHFHQFSHQCVHFCSQWERNKKAEKSTNNATMTLQVYLKKQNVGNEFGQNWLIYPVKQTTVIRTHIIDVSPLETHSAHSPC